jgi:hypothetical protein
MCKSVGDVLQTKLLEEAKGGPAEQEGAAESKILKERPRYLTDF